jgi:hypothetical protein
MSRGANVKVLFLGIVLVCACGAAFVVRAARHKRRQFDDRSDATKLVSSAGDRRQDSKTKSRFMGKR